MTRQLEYPTNEQYSEAETIQRRDKAVQRALSTPPKPYNMFSKRKQATPDLRGRALADVRRRRRAASGASSSLRVQR
jgi:hypothetical protein